MARRVPAEAARGLPMSEAELFGWVLEHSPRAKHTRTDTGNPQHQTRRGRSLSAAAWFLQQFDVGRLREAFEDVDDFDPNAPVDVKWMVKHLVNTAAYGKPQAQHRAWDRLRELQRLGALAHPDLQEELHRRDVASGRPELPDDEEDFSWGSPSAPATGGNDDAAEDEEEGVGADGPARLSAAG